MQETRWDGYLEYLKLGNANLCLLCIVYLSYLCLNIVEVEGYKNYLRYSKDAFYKDCIGETFELLGEIGGAGVVFFGKTQEAICNNLIMVDMAMHGSEHI